MEIVNQIVKQLKAEGSKESLNGMTRYGIKIDHALGVSIPFLRSLGKQHQKNHELALQLWDTNIHEARILASIIDDPKKVSESQIEAWVKDFDSWDICDQCCSNLFSLTKFAYTKALEWANREEEFEKRAGFVMMACLAHKGKNKSMKDNMYDSFFALIEEKANDERNMVKKAVNWALRQIGKRNLDLNAKAIKVCEKLLVSENKTTLWIAKDAYRELKSNGVQRRLKDLFML